LEEVHQSGRQASRIEQFHAFLQKQGIQPSSLLRTRAKPPNTTTRILLEPELLAAEPSGKEIAWKVEGEYLTSGAGDAGPEVDIPLRVPQDGTYRLWALYYGWTNGTAVTSLKIYRAADIAAGPVTGYDEVYDWAVAKEGPTWKDTLVDLAGGDYIIRLGHVTRWWHAKGGPGAYCPRKIDCIYLTDELWAEAPSAQQRQEMRAATKPSGVQWTATPAMPPGDQDRWHLWQVRPLSWEDAAANPKLFQLSRQFWQGLVNELAQKDYKEDAKEIPDYRAPERQVVFNDTWNLVANPVRARRQIDILNADISRNPLGYHYVWHDVILNIDGLRPGGRKEDDPPPPADYGGWYAGPDCLEASYGNPTGTVKTRIPVTNPGKYTLWVLSNPVNLSYTAPWFGKVTVAGKLQFDYHHEGKIPTVWMKMGELTVEKPDEVQVEFTLDSAGNGTTYRRIYTLFLVDKPDITPSGTVRPPWTMEEYRERAQQTGVKPRDQLLLWLTENPYRPLSQEVWSSQINPGDAWPSSPVKAGPQVRELLMARETNRALQVALRNLTDVPLPLEISISPLKGKGGQFPGAVTWRAEAFVPYGADRQNWAPFFLLRRPNITVPPLNLAGVWLTVDTHGVPAGDYASKVQFRGPDLPTQTVELKVRVSPVQPEPKQSVLIDGYTNPHEGTAYLRDFVDHGMNVWRSKMSKADMQKWGIRLLAFKTGETNMVRLAEWIGSLKAAGLDYADYRVDIMDEPGGTTPEALKPYLDVAKALRAVDLNVRICFNPGDAAQLATFQVLAPYCDFWQPYSLHVFSPYYGNPEKKKIYLPKPWMWYTTPCLCDKVAREPGIRVVPSQPGQCMGVGFFALNYPWRDQWDTGYEQIPDASTMGAVMSRHGPVATIVWEQIREASQTANLAMMVREQLGVKSFDEVTDPALQKLIREGTPEELIRWLETLPK
jgi:hypothetical protein